MIRKTLAYKKARTVEMITITKTIFIINCLWENYPQKEKEKIKSLRTHNRASS